MKLEPTVDAPRRKQRKNKPITYDSITPISLDAIVPGKVEDNDKDKITDKSV